MENPEVPIKKKRGRKPKNQLATENAITVDIQEVPVTPSVPKKRGRKPKGGKLFLKEENDQMSNATTNNVILHLKCGLNDLEEREQELHNVLKDPLLYNPNIPPIIQTYDNNNNQYFGYVDDTKGTDSTYAYDNENESTNPLKGSICEKCNQSNIGGSENNTGHSDVDIKDVNAKLKELKIQLYKGAQSDKNSACFWCTYEFDNHPCYIPKHEIDDVLYGYGSFCQPECAVAYLMKQNLDDSTKFEQYHLLNQIYSKVYDYKKNIKPAPDPYYLLDKFYGNLSIQEYRKLIKSEHMLLILDKPMTRTLPELHEDSEELGVNVMQSGNQNSNINTGIYKVKRNSEKQKGPSKNEIIRERFGI